MWDFGVAAAGLVATGVLVTGGAITCGALCGGAAVSTVPVIAGVANQVSKNVGSWPHPEDGRAIIDGIEYSQHALGRMMPNGMQWVDHLGRTIDGRGVPPSVVQNTIQFGKQMLRAYPKRWYTVVCCMNENRHKIESPQGLHNPRWSVE